MSEGSSSSSASTTSFKVSTVHAICEYSHYSVFAIHKAKPRARSGRTLHIPRRKTRLTCPAQRREKRMIFGAHVIVYSKDATADRAFLRDVLGLPSVDAGHGWLIFALPPAEVAVHP